MRVASMILPISCALMVGCSDSDLTTSTSPRSFLEPQAGGRAGTTGAVYVISQGLYYDTFATADPLPMGGKFQLIANGQTQFGPGDSGYLGGRWWEDLNGNQMQDEGDHFFLCPLLPPGRETP